MRLYIGKDTPESKNDTWRELVDMWEESDYCEIIRDETDDYFSWVKEPGKILLYEYDTYRAFPGLPENFETALFAGQQHPHRGRSWIYWARRPKLLEKKIAEGVKTYSERSTSSIFLGKCENTVQLHYRTQESWEWYMDDYNMVIALGNSIDWPYSQEEYLSRVGKSKFGLCLPGFGPKCNREIELLGLGVVPLMGPGVCTRYHNALKEGVHYFDVRNGEDLEEMITNCSEDQWTDMSNAGREWYEKNCSRQGSFETTCEIVDRIC